MLFYGNIIILSYIVLLIVIVLASNAEAIKYGPYDYYKVSIRWPKSYCVSEDVVEKRYVCQEPIVANFTIHGVWPMYRGENKEFVVRPYYEDRRCTETIPMPPQNITYDLLGPILDDMKIYWPNIVTHTKEYNENFWRYQWRNHGMCFDKPDDPLHYFGKGLEIIQQYDFLGTLEGKRVRPNNGRYNATQYKHIIRQVLGVEPQIFCVNDEDGNLIFSEIGVCFDKNGNKMNCPFGFYDCKNWRTQPLKFPAP